ncbi:5-oxoprolinase subunit PxpB [Thalassotalea crassostreae]|uniref:5-oxoprolinase subunit PxpB n=1 Tax=Thalassotalea crassostreae TaxID=1763536 RepID=UPI0008390668|nr:5-oxoprolinase subunit PxpB [Thalassotalea crassostreae]
MKISIAGENSYIIYFADSVSTETSAQIQVCATQLKMTLAEKLIDLIPSYASLLVIYDPLLIDPFAAKTAIKEVLLSLSDTSIKEGELITLPVYYSEESGQDLALIAEKSGLSVEQVIDIHQQTEYRVYAIGFAPGFAYLGEVDERIAMPRLASPRLKVPKGAVAIADRQTAVYPAQSPGGWNIIGLCPIQMFDRNNNPTMPISSANRVKFTAISREQFLELGGVL